MIDLERETLINLNQAARRVPGRDGRSVHISAIYRWINPGIAGVRLEAVRLGGRLITSVEALQRFAEGCSNGSGDAKAPPLRSEKERRAAAERAGERLAEMGV